MAYQERIQTKSQKQGHTHIDENIIMLSYCTDNMIRVFVNIKILSYTRLHQLFYINIHN